MCVTKIVNVGTPASWYHENLQSEKVKLISYWHFVLKETNLVSFLFGIFILNMVSYVLVFNTLSWLFNYLYSMIDYPRAFIT